MLSDGFLVQLQGMVQPTVRPHGLSGVEKAGLSRVAETVIQMKKERILPPFVKGKFRPDGRYLTELQERVNPAVSFVKLSTLGQISLTRIARMTLVLELMFLGAIDLSRPVGKETANAK